MTNRSYSIPRLVEAPPMHCPQCGQQQAPEVVRFCSRCGFPLDGVLQLLANGGLLPSYHTGEAPQISPRRRGVKQGGILLLTGILLVPVLGLFASFSDSNFVTLLAALAALICFIGGPLRMLYAGVFEESLPRPANYIQAPVPLHTGAPARASLPGTQFQPPPASWRERPRTSELVRPPSVTEGTTRLLDKEDPTNR